MLPASPIVFGPVVIAAFWVQALFSFGGALLATPVLALLIGMKTAVPLILLFQLLMGALALATWRRAHWGIALACLPGIIAGAVLGTFGFAILNERLLQLLLAATILGVLARQRWGTPAAHPAAARWHWALLAGGAYGIVQGLMGSGGPLIILYLRHALRERDSEYATAVQLMFLSNVVRLVQSIPLGIVTAETLRTAAPVAPFFLGAVLGGYWMRNRYRNARWLNEGAYRNWMDLLLAFAAVLLLGRAVLAGG